MTGGMATIAGGVLAAFVDLLSPYVADIGGHLLTASVLSAPAAVLFAKVIVPETEKNWRDKNSLHDYNEVESSANVLEAVAKGASTGMNMAIHIAAMLLAFIALVALCNGALEWLGDWIGFNSGWGAGWVPEKIWYAAGEKLSLEMLFAILFLPLALLIGVPLHECAEVAVFLGQKVVLNEFYAYTQLAQAGQQLSQKTMIICSYALCGFANFASIGIQIGGIGEIAPERRGELARLGLRAMVAGSLAAFTTACFANLLL